MRAGYCIRFIFSQVITNLTWNLGFLLAIALLLMIDIRKKEKEKGEEMSQTRVKNVLSSTEWNMCRRKQAKIAGNETRFFFNGVLSNSQWYVNSLARDQCHQSLTVPYLRDSSYCLSAVDLIWYNTAPDNELFLIALSCKSFLVKSYAHLSSQINDAPIQKFN